MAVQKKFYDPDAFQKLANMKLIARAIVEGFISGLHRSPYHGFSVEFAEYVGEAYESSRWFIDVLTPTEAGWNATDDREVSCLLYLWDDDVADLVNVSGSAAGTGGADG